MMSFALATGPTAVDAAALNVAVLAPELDGDLEGAPDRGEWPRRLSLLAEQLREGLDTIDGYRVVPSAAIAAASQAFKDRKGVHECAACLEQLGVQVGADRILAPWVFRMSKLMLTLHIELWDAKTGRRLLYRMLNFRSDTDDGWRRATEFFLTELRQQPAAQR